MDLSALRPLDACAGALALAWLIGRLTDPARPVRPAGLIVAIGVVAGLVVLTGRPLADWLAAGAAAALWVGIQQLRLRRTVPSMARRGVIVSGLGVTLVAGLATERLVGPVDDWNGIPPTRVPLTPLPTVTLVTDRGRTVTAFRPTDGLPGGVDPVAEEDRFLRGWEAAGRILRVASADIGSNCHGWTFTEGRCWVRSEDVDGILQDNRYRLVGGTPRRGDIAVYREPTGRVCHTGVVVGRRQDGDVLVESKWAWAGRFIHPAATQPYAPKCEFYRSSRRGHILVAGTVQSGLLPTD